VTVERGEENDFGEMPHPDDSAPEAHAGLGTHPEVRRILALDVGTRTIGLAVSDALGITAQGLETIRRKNKRADFGALERTIRRFHVSELVVGYPLRLSGAPSAQTHAVAEFAEELRARFPLPVHLWDERLTSAEANRILRMGEASIQKRAKAVDRMAAVLILQSFLEARGAGHR
jgi:putative Holliday junction resolvase